MTRINVPKGDIFFVPQTPPKVTRIWVEIDAEGMPQLMVEMEQVEPRKCGVIRDASLGEKK